MEMVLRPSRASYPEAQDGYCLIISDTNFDRLIKVGSAIFLHRKLQSPP